MGEHNCLSCGWVAPRESEETIQFQIEDTLSVGEADYAVTKVHESGKDAVRLIAKASDDSIVEIVVSTEKERVEHRKRLHIAHPKFFPPMLHREKNGAYWMAVFELGSSGSTLVSELATARSQRAINDCADLCETIVLPVVRMLTALHEEGLALTVHNASEVWLKEDGQVWLLDCPLQAQDESLEAYRVMPSFSPPEAYGRCGGSLGPKADVFFVGMILYHCLTRVPVPSTVGLVHDRLPAPSLFHPRVQPELEAVTKRATSLIPDYRYSDATKLMQAMEWALKLERKRTTPQAPLQGMEFAAETHIGLLKQRYCPENQDSHFASWDQSQSRGLFMVSDGVSVSEFGSGDQASRIVADATEALWQSLANEVLFNVDETLGAFDSTVDVSAEMALSPLPSGSGARNRLLSDMLDAANATIGAAIQGELPASMIHPEGIMAATAVCCLIEGARLTHCSIGDSRIYLIRDHHICTLNTEHNYASRLIAMGKDYNTSTSAPNAAALVQCVGEFEFDQEQRLLPVPLRPDFGELQLLSGDTIVMCSDGIPDYLTSSEEQSERMLIQFVEEAASATHLAYDLVVAANRGGGGDNLTCIVIKVS